MTGPTVVQPRAGNNQLSVERSFTGSSMFTRTVWLPRPADTRNVTAKLAEGILTLRIPKAEEKDAVKINVE
jgi:HSP20 family molecular chaperone IbpA